MCHFARRIRLADRARIRTRTYVYEYLSNFLTLANFSLRTSTFRQNIFLLLLLLLLARSSAFFLLSVDSSRAQQHWSSGAMLAAAKRPAMSKYVPTRICFSLLSSCWPLRTRHTATCSACCSLWALSSIFSWCKRPLKIMSCTLLICRSHNCRTTKHWLLFIPYYCLLLMYTRNTGLFLQKTQQQY